MKKFKTLFTAFISCFILLTSTTYATELTSEDEESSYEVEVPAKIFFDSKEDAPVVSANTALLADADTGRILYSKNAGEKVYPASITKLLTTLVAYEYIKEDDVIVVGNEINLVPWDSSKSGHIVGESLSGLNLFRAMLLPSGNDTSNVIALNVAKLYKDDPNLSFDEAELVFAQLMNEKAKSLGATNSNFISPHGYHDDDHYSTVEDLLIISMAAMENETIRNIVGEASYNGNGAGTQRTVDMVTQEYEWFNTNKLLLSGSYYYKYATGIKTGFTSQAGRCLVSSATKENVNLISIVLGCEEDEQFVESKKLLDFGFETYSINTLQENGAVRKEIYIDNPQLGEHSILELLNTDTVEKLLSTEEVENLKSEIIVDTEFISNKTTEDGDITLISNIQRGSEVATVTYTLNDNIIYKGSLVAARDIYPRTFSSDFEYYWEKINDIIFSWVIIPILFTLTMVAMFIIRIVNQIKIRNRKKNRNRASRDKYKFKSKY